MNQNNNFTSSQIQPVHDPITPSAVNPSTLSVTSTVIGLIAAACASFIVARKAGRLPVVKQAPKLVKQVTAGLAGAVVFPLAFIPSTLGIRYMLMEGYTRSPWVPKNPHDVIVKEDVSVKINQEMSEFFRQNLQPSSALQLKIGCSATAIGKTSSAVVALTAGHCVPDGSSEDEYGLQTFVPGYEKFIGQEVSTATNKPVGKITQVFQPKSPDPSAPQDMALVVIQTTPKILSTINTILVATPQEAQRMLSEDLLVLGFPRDDSFIDGKGNARLHVNWGNVPPWLGCMKKNNARVSQCLEEARKAFDTSRNLTAITGTPREQYIDYELQNSAGGFSGGGIFGESEGKLRLLAVLAKGDFFLDRFEGKDKIALKTFVTVQTGFCVNKEGKQTIQSLAEILQTLEKIKGEVNACK
jgi:hypothetical protein